MKEGPIGKTIGNNRNVLPSVKVPTIKPPQCRNSPFNNFVLVQYQSISQYKLCQTEKRDNLSWNIGKGEYYYLV